MSDGADDKWWSPYFERRWDLDELIQGDPPREARRYYPPISRGSRLTQLALIGLTLAPAAWFFVRQASGGETAMPLVALVVALTFSAAILVLPRLVNPPQRPQYDLERQLSLAAKGRFASATVQRVEHTRQRVRVGYRDGSAIDTRAGNAYCRFERDGGVATEVIIPFDSEQPPLRDGDRVAVLYDPQDSDDCMAVLHMTDVEFRSSAPMFDLGA